MISCIRNPINCINQGLSNAYKAAENGAVGIQNGYNHAVSQVKHGVSTGVQAVNEALRRSVDAIVDFTYRNSTTLFYIGCGVVLTTFSPNLFLPAALASLAIRIETTRRLKQAASEYLKEEKNPFNQQGPGRAIISTLDVALAGIAALDSLALGTVFSTSYLTPHLLPIVGGIAIGSSLAKLVMRYIDGKEEGASSSKTSLSSKNPVVIEVKPEFVRPLPTAPTTN